MVDLRCVDTHMNVQVRGPGSRGGQGLEVERWIAWIWALLIGTRWLFIHVISCHQKLPAHWYGRPSDRACWHSFWLNGAREPPSLTVKGNLDAMFLKMGCPENSAIAS